MQPGLNESSDAGSTYVSLAPCFTYNCNTEALDYFECSLADCPGPSGDPASPLRRRIKLCPSCARGHCPFCQNSIRLEDLRSVTSKPASLPEEPDFTRQEIDGEADANMPHLAGQTLEQFNQEIQQIADKVQERMRDLKRSLAKDVCDHPELGELIKQAEAVFQSLKREHDPDCATYRWMISMYARANEREKVESWGYEMENTRSWSTDGYNGIIFSFASLPKGIDRADMWFKRMTANGIEADSKSYTLLIQACAKSQDKHRAAMYLNRMRHVGIKPNAWTYSHLIDLCANDAKGTGLQQAEQLWNEMEQVGEKPFDFTFKCLLKVCKDAGNVPKALNVYNQMLEAGLSPDVVVFTTIIGTFIHTGDVQGAEEWFGKMVAAGIKANVVAFTCVITVCSKAGDLQNAVRWLGLMRQAGFEPSERTFRSLIRAGLNRADVDEADRWLKQMKDAGATPTVTTFNILLEYCAKTANLMQAETWFGVMEEACVTPDAETFNSLIEACINPGLRKWLRWRPWTEMESRNQQKWFFRMAEFGVKPDEATYAILTRARFSVPSWVFAIGIPLAFLLVFSGKK